MKMAAATENRQYVSIIDSEKMKKFQNLNNNNNNNNNPVSSVLNSNSNRRPRNDSMSFPSTLFPCISPLNDGESILDWIVKDDCMWSTAIHESELPLEYSPDEEADVKVHLSDATAHRPDTAPSAANLSPPLAKAAAASDLPPSPPPSGTSVSAQSDSASYALSSLDELDLELVSSDNSLDLLDVTQLHLLFNNSPVKRAPWNDEISADVRPKVLPGLMARRGLRPAPKVAPQCTTLKRPLTFDEQPVANKMRRTVAASAARTMSNLTDCEVVIREEEQEALEHVEIEYEVEDETQSDAPVITRDCTVPRRLIYPRNLGPRVAQAGLQRVRPGGLLQPNRVARPQRAFGLVNPGARVAFGAPGASARPTRVGSFPTGRVPFSGAPLARQQSFAGRLQQSAQFACDVDVDDDTPLAGRLLGRPPKRFSMPSYVGTPVDDGALAPRRGSSSYCSQMERNRRREMNTALAALRRLILEDDRSLLSKVYAENQINRRNTSMIMTLRAAHDAIIKLNDNARRANEERMEQLRRRERLHKRLQQLTSGHTQTQPHVSLVNIKHEWS